jgi:hypothetical protein
MIGARLQTREVSTALETSINAEFCRELRSLSLTKNLSDDAHPSTDVSSSIPSLDFCRGRALP